MILLTPARSFSRIIRAHNSSTLALAKTSPSDIENSPLQNGDQLRLSRRRKLEMQTAQRAYPLGARLIVLDEAAGNANCM
jgi:hypothetical protein